MPEPETLQQLLKLVPRARLKAMHKHISKHPDTEHLPDDVVHYREYKIPLQPDRFTINVASWSSGNKWENPLRNSVSKLISTSRAFTARFVKCCFTIRLNSTSLTTISSFESALFDHEGWPRADHELTLKSRTTDVKTAAKG